MQTREQLGYVVAGGLHLLWNKSMIGGLSFRVLSKTHGPDVRVALPALCVHAYRRLHPSESIPIFL